MPYEDDGKPETAMIRLRILCGVMRCFTVSFRHIYGYAAYVCPFVGYREETEEKGYNTVCLWIV